MKFKELTKGVTEKIKLIISSNSPKFVPESPWLSVYPCKPEDIFNNYILLEKAVTAAILISGTGAYPADAIYACDIVRADGSIFDVDRYLLKPSGLKIFIQKGIHKDFPEHHSQKIPDYYH